MSITPVTSPVEATLRILMNGVPFLMGAAVVRQPPGTDGVVASVGRMPWLHDRRLTTLQLPDDTLPSNRAVALDWPVPFQAEWVGAPPRLLISRLVFQGRTVGVLLGTLVTREPISQQTREALDLSGELIASAMAGESAYTIAAPSAPRVEAEPQPMEQRPLEADPVAEAPVTVPASVGASAASPPPPPQLRSSETLPPVPTRGVVASELVVDEVRRGLATAADARSLGRVLRDAMSVITDASAFSIALFHATRSEVAYRYKVVGPDRDSAELGRQHVDDGPACYAARHDRRWHVFAREIAIRTEIDARVREVIVLQLPLSAGGEVFGVVTVQTFRPEGFTDQELRLVATVVEASSAHFAQARSSGRLQPSGPAMPGDVAATVLTQPAAAAPTPTPAGPTASTVLKELLRRCAGAGFTTMFFMGVDPGAATLRGELVSDGESARELDYALGITSGKFAIPRDDRYNAIARAVREGRIVPAPTLYEITRPATDFDKAQSVERLVHGGRSVTLPLIVNGEAAGALVIGPMPDEPSFFAVEAVRGYVDDATKQLSGLWQAAK